MIALDTSSVIAFLSGESGKDVAAVEAALAMHQGVLPPLVLSELLSDPSLSKQVARVILSLPTLEIQEGYWERAGRLRADLLGRGLKARLADSLIAQSCLDHSIALITRDRDFVHFARHKGLRLR